MEIVFVLMEDVDVAIYTGGLNNLRPLDVEWKTVNESVMAVASSDIIKAASGCKVTVFERVTKGYNTRTYVYTNAGGDTWLKYSLKEELI